MASTSRFRGRQRRQHGEPVRQGLAWSPTRRPPFQRHDQSPSVVYHVNQHRAFQKHNVPIELDYLSIDIDSADLWVMRSILSVYRPRVITVEIQLELRVRRRPGIGHHVPRPFDDGVHAGELHGMGRATMAPRRTRSPRSHVRLLRARFVDAPYDLFFVRKEEWKGDALVDETTKAQHLRALPNHRPMASAEARNLIDYDVFMQTASLCEARAAAAAQLRHYAAMHKRESAACVSSLSTRRPASKCERYRCFQQLGRLPVPRCGERLGHNPKGDISGSSSSHTDDSVGAAMVQLGRADG